VNGPGIIDQFLNAYTSKIDAGFGLIAGDVNFVASTLVVIDITLAALFWSWGAEDDIIARLVKKTLFVGVFAYLITNWNSLAGIIFNSFVGLGLKASGSGVSTSTFLQPGQIAQTGLTAGQPILQSISGLMGYVSFFENFIQIVVLLFAWFVVVLAFFIMAVQLFVALIEFKLTTLCGFVLVPFGLFGKTAFMAERVLGLVVSSGIKVLVLAVIFGIGSTLFGQITSGFPTTPTISDAMTIVLAALAIMGLGIFGPKIANGIVSGGPQLGAGAAVGTAMAAGGIVAAGAAATGLAVGGAVGLTAAAARGGATLAGGATGAYRAGGAAGVARAAGSAAASPLRRAAEALKARFDAGAAAGARGAGGGGSGGGSSGPAGPAGGPTGGPGSGWPGPNGGAPGWARRMKREQSLRTGADAAHHAIGSGDGGGGGASVDVSEDD
jgi:type IV secretion system protein TrbL